MVLHNIVPKRMRTVITHKPPAPGDTYQDPQIIELYDESGRPTGAKIGLTAHMPQEPLEIDPFPVSLAQITLQYPSGERENVALSGPTVVEVKIPPTGDASDTDGDGRDQVASEMVQLALNGGSAMGPVFISLYPGKPSLGEIEERANNTPGKLDVPPFTATGTADSFFDVWFQVKVGTQTFYAARPVHMQTVITHKPPGPLTAYVSPDQAIDLLDAAGNLTGIKLVHATHSPNPPRIEKIVVDNSAATLVIVTEPGLRYTLEYKNNLTDPAWTILRATIAPSEQWIVTTPSTFGSKFFRVRTEYP
jgi:hypothetical protein